MLGSENHSDVAGSLLDDIGYTEMLQNEKTIESKFTNHPGKLEKVWFPTNRSNSIKWLKNFW